MSFLGALGGIAGAVVGGIFQNEAADKAADTQVALGREGLALQRDMFDQSMALLQPTINRGNAAADLYAAQFGITPQSPGNAGVGNALAIGGTDGGSSAGDAYIDAYPDLVAAWDSNASSVHNRFDSRGDWGNWHYNNYGRGEGRTSPDVAFADYQATLPGAEGTAGAEYAGGSGLLVPGGDTGSLQDQYYDRFLSSGHNQAATNFTAHNLDQLRDAYGAGGSLLSGSAIGAMGDRLARNRYGAYIDYGNALAGVAGAGQTSSSLASGQAQQFGAMQAAGLNNIGNARASSYAQQGANNYNTIGNVFGVLGNMGWGGGGGSGAGGRGFI